jgi:hypothetical protein
MATTDAASTTGMANVKRLDITLPFFIPVRFSAGPTPEAKCPVSTSMSRESRCQFWPQWVITAITHSLSGLVHVTTVCCDDHG